MKGGVASGEGGVFVFFSGFIGVRDLAWLKGLLNIETFCEAFPAPVLGIGPEDDFLRY